MIKITKVTLSIVLISIAAFVPQQEKVSGRKVDAAINKGVKWLLEKTKAYVDGGKLTKENMYFKRGPELILYTLVHADVTEKNPVFKKLLEKVLSTKPSHKETYRLALEAMALVSYKKRRYQDRIAECAQALVNRQCRNGQWTYRSGPIKPTNDLETQDSKPLTTHGDNKLKKIYIKRQSWGPAKGDNSNTQYAALGLIACSKAKIIIDKQVLKLAKECYEKSQNKDGGWDYSYHDNSKQTDFKPKPPRIGPTRQRPFRRPINRPVRPAPKSYGSMTVGGLAALAGYKQLLNEDIKNDSHIKKAIEWLAKNFKVDQNPGKGAVWHFLSITHF